MSHLSDVMGRIRAEGRPALVGYLPAGFPDKQTAIDAMVAMVEGGVDVVEIGLPYSDPVMDGPTIQKAADAALRAGTRVADVFDTVEAVAATGAPTLVMTYWNPIERVGVDAFSARLAAVGGAGLITPDLIPDEAGEWLAASAEHGLDRVFLVAPSSTDARIAMTAQASSGFLYATSVMGVTGARTATSTAAPALVERVRAVSDIPVGVGLGVSNGDQAAEVGRFADAVIVGSALVACLLQAGTDTAAGVAAVRRLAEDLRAGVERARAAAPASQEGAPA
ncbi:tryptophan synthase subunit alpha [Mumia sp. DW29H23]|uniref:tryptophan synthase subunit alpha n=1 Tax=Mumia sp. DW29H23 TaxID=3421241 RepID=UPI003D687497